MKPHKKAGFAAVLLFAAAVAGCLGGGDGDVTAGDGGRDPHQGPSGALFGWVVDASFEPIPDVNLSVIGDPAETSTNATGYFSFPRLERGEELVVIARHDAFVTQSKRIILPVDGSMRLNYTMEPLPVKTPYDEVLSFEGLLACQAVVQYEEPHMAHAAGSPFAPSVGIAGVTMDGEGAQYKFDCGSMDPNNADLWEFTVRGELAGVIVEVEWEPGSELARFFRLTLETAGHGTDEPVLAQVVGPSVLGAQVNNHQATAFYQEGGIIKAHVEVDPNVDDQEMGTGVAFAYQQEFRVIATAFYVDPPPATYSYFS